MSIIFQISEVSTITSWSQTQWNMGKN